MRQTANSTAPQLDASRPGAPSSPATGMSDKPDKPGEFTRLYRHTVEPLRRYLYRFLRDRNEAEDIAHDAYLRVYPELEKDRATKPEALLYTTARNLALNRIKRRKIAPISALAEQPDWAPSSEPGVVQQVAARQDWARLEAAIAALPPGCRQVLVLRKLELLSHQEIADRLGIAISTVEKQHARALRLLRTALTEVTATTTPPTAITQEDAQ